MSQCHEVGARMAGQANADLAEPSRPSGALEHSCKFGFDLLALRSRKTEHLEERLGQDHDEIRQLEPNAISIHGYLRADYALLADRPT